ncbi:TRAP transporter small permease [Pseudovibrio exalbescens]|uniref:TRAP transporter small permease protein n=1 Tax=Pseudovibrio exalbescens TaxID=197461 RepID=A0A1U7JMD0_9HYPH|nr:TRAP transporter small permease [Pseudovibrio exalbescens]OKL45852.1 C4-dicarboxylate ABC transporter permease [Pseudovibrio exalbescens]
MNRITNTVDTILKTVVISVFAVLVVCVVWQVLSRYVLGTPSTFTDELARFMFIWIGLIGAAYTLGQRRHLAIDLLTGPLTGIKKRYSDYFIIAAILTFSLLIMVYGGSQLVMKTLITGQVSPALRVPMGYVYAAIPFSGVVMVYYSIEMLVGLIKGTGTGPNDQPIDHDDAQA